MGLLRIIKPVEVDPDDGEIIGMYPFEVQTPRMHGSRAQWEGQTARGNLRRMAEKPNSRGGPGRRR